MSSDADGRGTTLDVLSIRLVHAARPKLPPTWQMLHGGDPEVCECHGRDGAHWVHRGEGLSVIESVAVELDGRPWHHVSVARRSRMPDYADLGLVRRLFAGEDREAYQVFPPSHRYVNQHAFALHLFTCLDAPGGVLPAFERGGPTL